MKERIKFLIFDWSGVISNDMKPTFLTYNLLFQHYQVPEITFDYFLKNFELPYSRFTEKHLPGIPLEEIQELFRQLFKTVEHNPSPIPGTADVLKELQNRKYILSVLSSHPYVTKESELFFPGESFFSHIYEDIPDKVEVVSKLLEDSGFSAEQTVYVGDMIHDIEAGRQANVTTIGVLTGYQTGPELLEAGADRVIQNLKELLSLL